MARRWHVQLTAVMPPWVNEAGFPSLLVKPLTVPDTMFMFGNESGPTSKLGESHVSSGSRRSL
jgi:hypothetical protein